MPISSHRLFRRFAFVFAIAASVISHAPAAMADEETRREEGSFLERYTNTAHDLILKGLETSIERVLINDVDEGTFFARIILRMENELGKKIIELDARPSDSIVLALQMKQPIHVAQKVLDNVEDMSEILERILRKQD